MTACKNGKGGGDRDEDVAGLGSLESAFLDLLLLVRGKGVGVGALRGTWAGEKSS